MRFTRIYINMTVVAGLLASTVGAQVPVTGTEVLLDKLRLNSSVEGKDNPKYADIQGDPYIYKDFQKGTLYILPDEKCEVNVRYDIYANQMHLKDKDQIYAIIHPEKVKTIEAGSYRFVYSSFLKSLNDTKPPENSYFIVKTDGKCKLLVKKNIRIQDPEPSKLYQEAKPAKFILKSDTYFLKIENRSAIEIRNKKELLSVLDDKKDAVSSFISSNKLDVKDLNDLVRIVSFYNGE